MYRILLFVFSFSDNKILIKEEFKNWIIQRFIFKDSMIYKILHCKIKKLNIQTKSKMYIFWSTS